MKYCVYVQKNLESSLNVSWRDGRPEFSSFESVRTFIYLLLSRLHGRIRTKSDFLKANIVGTWSWPPALYLLFIQFHPPLLVTIRLPTFSCCLTASSVLQVEASQDSLYAKLCFSSCIPSFATCQTHRILPYFTVRKTLNDLHNPFVYPLYGYIACLTFPS